jgi:hypothetical protein
MSPLGAAHADTARPDLPAADAGVEAKPLRPADADDVEHMCALLTGCDHLPLPAGLVPKDFAVCVRTMAQELASGRALELSLLVRECGLGASSCAQLRTCALRGVRPDACAGRAKAGPVDHCDADGRAVSCLREQVTLVRDCPRAGEQCSVVDGAAHCGLGACAADAPRSCSPSGSKIIECRQGRLLSTDCTLFGMRCEAGTTGPACVPRTRPCAQNGEAAEAERCDGDVAVTCLRGHEVRVDCGAAGLACGGQGAVVGACRTKDPAACTEGPARCDGGNIRYCVAGRARSYNCRALGLARCVATPNGARCAP